MALKRAGASAVRVFAVEGEGGLTTGASHETRNSAWGLGLDNLVYLVDWNDHGIDPRPASSVVYGGPDDWFGAAGWRVVGAQQGSEWADVTRTLLGAVHGANPKKTPTCAWFKTIKGRGYGVTGYKSHGTPHKMNSEPFWKTRTEFGAKYGIAFEGQDQPAPTDKDALRAQIEANFQRALSLFDRDPALLDYLADRLVEIGDSVPEKIETLRFDAATVPFHDRELWDFTRYPEEMWAKPGESQPNRAGFAKWGAFTNAIGRKKYGRPLFLVMSADLADSTNIAGFAKEFGGVEGWGWYERDTLPEGVLLPQQITEFTNSGISAGIACVNLHPKPYEEFNGFYAAHSTYGSFSYLKYGLMRLFSQVAQDSEIKVGKVLWVAGHSGPETAEDSRTHFGIYEPSVAELFPDGHVCNVIPWEHNEVPGRARRGVRAGFPDRRAASHAPRGQHSRPRRTGNCAPLRGGEGRVSRFATSPPASARAEPCSSRARFPPRTSSRCSRRSTRRSSTCASSPRSARSSSRASRRKCAIACSRSLHSSTAWRSRIAGERSCSTG